MIDPNAFFTDTMNTVDMVIGTFVQTVYNNLVQGNKLTITLLFTLYVMLIGYRILTNISQASSISIVRHLIIVSAIYGLLINWNLYNTLVYNVFTNEPGDLAQVVINSSGQIHAGETVAQAMDSIFSAFSRGAANFYSHIGWSSAGLGCLLYGTLILIAGIILCVFALLFMIYAKMGMAIALALGPIFLIFFLWDSTRGIFSAWINKLITFALIPIILAGVMSLMLSIINVTLPSITQPPEQSHFTGILIFCALSFVTAIIFYFVKSYASALGGFMIGGISQGISGLKGAAEHTGVPSLFGKIADSASNAFRGGMDNFQQRNTERKDAAAKQAAEQAKNQKINDFFK